MIVIVMGKTMMNISQYNNVSNIAYNSGAGTFTLTYGSNQTATFAIANNTIHIMES